MDLQVLKDLVKIMDKGKLSKLHVKEKSGFEVCLERTPPAALAKPQFQHSMPENVLPAPAPAPAAVTPKAKASSGHSVNSPMVGTFYSSPSPDDPTFVKVGDSVEKGTVVCIIEAMKVMNEVKSDRAGVIKEVLVENMQPVEFGTPLFTVE